MEATEGNMMCKLKGQMEKGGQYDMQRVDAKIGAFSAL